MNVQDYRESAKLHEFAFRLLLTRCKVEHETLSIDEIYNKYSEGRRVGLWTIINFEEVQPNIFEFAHQNIAPLSGFSTIDLWTVENNQVKFVANIYRLRS